MYYTVNMKPVNANLYIFHTHVLHLYIILLLLLLLLLSHSNPVYEIGCYKGELPETLSELVRGG